MVRILRSKSHPIKAAKGMKTKRYCSLTAAKTKTAIPASKGRSNEGFCKESMLPFMNQEIRDLMPGINNNNNANKKEANAAINVP